MHARNDADRERLDRLLVERGLASTRARAQALIMAGRVQSEGRRLDKSGTRLPRDIRLEVTPGARYVGRGGHKLAPALGELGIDVAGRDGMDVGASTGGFTQVLLEAGASRVIALDVGRGQLDYALRSDPRVHPIEGLNARYLEPGRLPFVPSIAVVDVSFISLELVLPAVARCLAAPAEILALIKPQFEVGRGKVGRGGIVTDRDLHRSVLERIVRLAVERGWGPRGLCASALRGADGNQEYFLYLTAAGGTPDIDRLARRVLEVSAEEER